MPQGVYLMHIFLIITTIYKPKKQNKTGKLSVLQVFVNHEVQYNCIWNITTAEIYAQQLSGFFGVKFNKSVASAYRVTSFFSSLKFLLAKDYCFRIFYMLLIIFIFLHLYLKSPCFTACLNEHILIHAYSHYIVLPFVSKCSNSLKQIYQSIN